MSLEDMKRMPLILKPFTLVLSILFLLFSCLSPDRNMIWFCIVVAVIQLIISLFVFGLYLIDTAVLITHPMWPTIEVIYCGIFVIADLVSAIIFFAGLFYYFDLFLIISMGLSILLGLSFALIALINWRGRSNSSNSNNQATASATYPSGINPGV